MSDLAPASGDGAHCSVALSLVSHTNVGKTTLARTLLVRDIGEVRDAPHVTEFNEVHTLVETAAGERLCLWDTPGFGDTVRLVKRLRAAERPIVRFLSETWDRWRDRGFWASQQAVRNLRDEADLLLYLVDASQSPEAAGYVAPEMELLGWIGKPVVVLLNQLGAPGADGGDDDAARWRRALGGIAIVRAVLPLDAFARCWVQELTLLRVVEQALRAERRPAMARLAAAWRERRESTFAAAMRELAASVARTALAAETVADRADLKTRLRQAGAAIGIGKADDTPSALAQRALAERLDAEARADTLALIRLHGLGGSAEHDIVERLAAAFDLRLRVDEANAAAWGGAVTGALLGLKADVLSGGLTLGGGLLTGGILGALGGAGIARGVNLVRGTDRSLVAWKGETLDAVVDAALLRYLAVAHFGRGRGDWTQAESPAYWKDVVADALAPHRAALGAAWAGRELGAGDVAANAAAVDALAARIEPIVRDAGWQALRRLYPQADMAGAAPENAHAAATASPP
jgi:hypothetical protein